MNNREGNSIVETTSRDGSMSILSKEKVKVLAEKNGWSLALAEGFVDGETFRRRGKLPSTYARIGIDEYCLGFRAAYYERQNPTLVPNSSPEPTVARLVARSPVQESLDVVPATAQGI
ncbi:MAG TPA: hypothetical protein VHB46_16445 [Burkholderiales bacterium]|nr:hypothetical protein [Burkholderiales bacterium]